jgi:hypothetical protein
MTGASVRQSNWYWVAAGLLMTSLLLGFHRTSSGWCPECWARIDRTTLGLGAAHGLDVGLIRWHEAGETAPGIARHLAQGHVHRLDGPTLTESQRGPWIFLGSIACGRHLPSEFARALAAPDFSDFVAARVADGRIDADAVRALIAVPTKRQREFVRWADDPSHRALMDKGAALHAEFNGVPRERSNLWRD